MRLADPISTADGSGPGPTAPGQVFIAFDANGKSYECDHHEFLSALTLGLIHLLLQLMQ